MNGFESFSIYSLLEADEDQATDNVAPTANTSSDNFDINTSLEDDEGSEEDTADTQSEDEGESEEGMEDEGGEAEEAAPPEENSEEPVDGNTEVFYALSKEEQQMKITMLKKQYQQLYTSSDELINRINNLDTDEANIITVSKLSETIVTLKKYISDYIIHIFPIKSFVENDIMLNRFLDIINTISISFDKLCKNIEKEEK